MRMTQAGFHDFFFFFFLVYRGLTLSPRLERSGMTIAHSCLDLPGSSDHDPPISASLIVGATGTRHHAQLILYCKDEVSLCCPGWSQTPGLKPSVHLGLPHCWDSRREPPHWLHMSFNDSSAYPLRCGRGPGSLIKEKVQRGL
uniref:Uncharacterized protein n=1 Tax=Macaca fascicularis TaxID=9541 RepID=A0A7N9IE33_MACFA